jgi:hypothetical protein
MNLLLPRRWLIDAARVRENRLLVSLMMPDGGRGCQEAGSEAPFIINDLQQIRFGRVLEFPRTSPNWKTRKYAKLSIYAAIPFTKPQPTSYHITHAAARIILKIMK